MTAAGVIGETSARYAVNGRALPLRYRYHDDDISSALLTAARRLGRSPRPKEYEEERQRIRGEALRQGEMRALPSMDVIRKRYGSWNEALGKAGLAPVEHPSQPHLGKRHPTYTEEEKLEWIRRAFVQLGEPFTAASYKRWRNQKVEQTDADIPCLATIERTLGGWRSARERALPG
ncbi:MAG: hypothetical protein M3O78_03215 [Chloroflexota bacterium]|nr:hypothetical protein [Chloroflexota bacterium]